MFGMFRRHNDHILPVDYANLVRFIRESTARPSATPRVRAKLAALASVPHALNNPLTALTAATYGSAQPPVQPQPATHDMQGGTTAW